MDKKPKTFSLRDLFLSVACFAVACVICVTDWKIISQNNWPQSDTAGDLFVLLSVPLIGTAVGGGIGALVGSFRKNSIVDTLYGLVLGVPLALLLLPPRVHS